MNKEIAEKNLKLAVAALGKLKITYWLEAGTCLGAWREHDFIDHDQDIDLGIYAEDCADEAGLNRLIGAMEESGFSLHHIFGKLERGFEIAFKREGVKLDIFWFYLSQGKRWHAAWRNGGRNGESDLIKLVFSAELFEKLGAVRVFKQTFKVPNPTDDYLVERYGPEWLIPNMKWNWATDPRCINNKFQI